MKGCFVGSGSEGMQQPEICSQIVELVGKPPQDITVLYLGTATYDLPGPKHNQTSLLFDTGCTITDILVTGKQTPREDFAALCEGADVIIVSGGNTLWAMNKWNDIGLISHLRAAAERGCVLTGGSAGAICWFDAGHSDSMDPDTYKDAMLGATAGSVSTGSLKDEASSAPTSDEERKEWQYIRCPCLGFFPGLVCPHADKVQSNGILRCTDFDSMLLRHPGERGICIDHFAALCVDGDTYWVLSLPGRPGSLLPDSSFSETRQGIPAIWVKDIEDGVVRTSLVASTGALSDLLRKAEYTDPDPRLDACMRANPL